MLLISTASASETAMIMDVLEKNDVQALAEPKNFAMALTVYTGTSVYGDDIYVMEDSFPAAKEAIEGMFSTK